MKRSHLVLFTVLATWSAHAQVAEFSALQQDGTVELRVNLTGTVYVVESAARLDQPWLPYGAGVPTNSALRIQADPWWPGGMLRARAASVPYPPPDMGVVPGGWFQQGDPQGVDTSAAPVRLVYTDKVLMDRHEVTCASLASVFSWAERQGYPLSRRAYLGFAGRYIRTLGSLETDLFEFGTPDTELTYDYILYKRLRYNYADRFRPARSVTWYGAAAYCNYRSLYEGLEACYDLDTGRCDFTRNGYRLPTEAEWEKAARGGLTGHNYPWLGTSSWPTGDLYSASACYSATGTVDTGTFPPNAYGFYDLAGNVKEWCQDGHEADAYLAPDEHNPHGATNPVHRVLRGGSWQDGAEALRCAARDHAPPGEPFDGRHGFRCVRAISELPWIQLQGASPLQINRGTPYTEPGYIASDLQDGDLSGEVAIVNTVDTSTLGRYELTYTVQDYDGHAAQPKIRVVEVTNGDPPSFALSGQTTLVLERGTPYVEPGYFAYDSEDGDVTAQVQVEGSVDESTQGYYPITYTVTDTDGNTVTVLRKVVVAIGAPPEIHLGQGDFMWWNYGRPFHEPGYVAEDDEDGDLTDQVAVSGSIDPFTLGVQTLTYSVMDSDGNPAAPAIRQVHVADWSPPDLVLTRGPTLPWDLGEPFVDPGWTAVDNVDGDLGTAVVVEGGVNPATEGVYTLTYSVTDSSGHTAAERRYVVVMDRMTPPPGMVHVPAGTFHMGDHWDLVYPPCWEAFPTAPDDEAHWDQPVHEVYVDDFFITQYEVTRAEFFEALRYYTDREEFLYVPAPGFNSGGGWGGSSGFDILHDCGMVMVISDTEIHPQPVGLVPTPGSETYPITPGTPAALALYANYKSLQDSLEPCYDVSVTPPVVDMSKNGYRACTEAEWEKAARGGLTGMHYPWGGDSSNYKLAFREEFTTGGYAPVGSYPPNGYGIYDMAGNAKEFCLDTFDEYAYVRPWATAPDPVYLAGSPLVIRGGPFDCVNDPRSFRCSARSYQKPHVVYVPRGGIRLVRRP